MKTNEDRYGPGRGALRPGGNWTGPGCSASMDRVVGRQGEFYDQDADESEVDASLSPAPIRWGGFYDQDASIEQPRLDPETLARIEREFAERRRVGAEQHPSAPRNGDSGPAGPPAPEPIRLPGPQVPAGPGPGSPGRPGAGWAEVPPATPAPRPEIRAEPRPDPRPAVQPRPQARSQPAPPAPGAGSRSSAPGRVRPASRAAARSRTPSYSPAPTRDRGAATGSTGMGRATAVLAFGTFASRITGFVRVLAIGYVLGVGSLSDAFNYANGIPNIIYDLLVGGILAATLIPVFVEHLGDDDRQRGSRALSAVLTAITVALLAVSVLLWVIAPWIIRFYLILNTHSASGAEQSLATDLLRYFAPQVFFLGTIVTSTALLNARRRFAVAALSPVVNNLVAIAALLVTKFVADRVLSASTTKADGTLIAFAHDQKAILILGLGTTAGYAVQLLIQLPATHRLGLHLRPVWDLRHPAVRRVAGLSSWLIGVVIANQVSLALVMVLAGRTFGWVTAYQFSFQFFQLPYALVAVSVASAIMPDLSERWANRQRIAFERQFVTGLRVTLAVLIPISFVYMAVAQPFITLAIQHGRVSASGAHLITSSLVMFAVGLPGFSAFFLLMRAYQAMQDARSMFWIYALENGLTVIAAPILSALMGEPGLALAWVGPYTIASVYAVVKLRDRVGSLGGWLTVRALMRIVLASAVTVAVVVAVGIPFSTDDGYAKLISRLVVQVVAGIGIYGWMAHILGVRELRPVMAMAARLPGRRRRATRPTPLD